MLNKFNNPTLIIGLVLALIAGALCYVVLSRNDPTVPVVVVNKNLLVGTVIEEKDLVVKNYPPSMIPNSSFKDISQVVGETVSVGPIMNGDIVRAEHLSDASSLYVALQTYAPKGWKATQLPEECGTSMRGIKRGDVVDIHADTVGGGVDQIVRGIVLAEPTTTDDGILQGYIIAVPTEYANAVAELVVKDMSAALMLPEDRTISSPTDPPAGVPTVEGGEANE